MFSHLRNAPYRAGTLCETCNVPPLLFDICFWTGYFNSCLNPFIYASTSREYKRAFDAILRCQWFKPRDGTLHPHDQQLGTWPGNCKVPTSLAQRKRGGSDYGQHQQPVPTLHPSAVSRPWPTLCESREITGHDRDLTDKGDKAGSER